MGSDPNRRFAFAIPLVILVLLVVQPLAGEEGCFHVPFESPPLWSSSLTWRAAGGWVLADPGSGELRLFSPRGEAQGRLIRPGQGPYEFNKPVHAVAVDEGLLLLDSGTHWLWLDDDLEPLRQLDHAEKPTARGEVLGSPFRWAATRDGRVFAYLHLREEDGTWWTGLARLSLGEPLGCDRMLGLDRFQPVATFHTLTLATVATVGEKGYFLQMDDPVHVVEAPGLRRLQAAVPPHLRKVPGLPPLRAETVGAFYEALARRPLAAGLYGHGGRLFLLERDPDDGGVRWKLHEIDVREDRVARTVVLPTRADWIVLAPGPEHWAILEAGPVQGLFDQELRGLTLVPAAWIEGSGSPLAAGTPTPECARGPATAAAETPSSKGF